MFCKGKKKFHKEKNFLQVGSKPHRKYNSGNGSKISVVDPKPTKLSSKLHQNVNLYFFFVVLENHYFSQKKIFKLEIKISNCTNTVSLG